MLNRFVHRYLLILGICYLLSLPAFAWAGKEGLIPGFAILSPGSIAMSAGKSSFPHNLIPDQIIETLPAISNAAGGLSYQWEKSLLPLSDFTAIAGASQTSLTFTEPLLQTTYFRRKVTDAKGYQEYSNTIKISIVSIHHENINYVREHEVLLPAQTDWKAIDLLPIGQKLQTTTYSDGLGRPIQKLSRETATPADPQANTLWGDVVQFITYDAYGRSTRQYLPFTTTEESGKYKSSPFALQEQHYQNSLQETHAFTQVSFENNPLNRVHNTKAPGQSWAAGQGNTQQYELNDASDSVLMLTIGYTNEATPVMKGFYPDKTLFRNRYLDENGKQVVEYTNTAGQLLLKKIQLYDNPSSGIHGWICTYSVYDDYGRLRFVLQPEAVRYAANNQWSFVSAEAQTVVNEWCFQYRYDDKGRNVFKKAPGAKALSMLYDDRDRVIFMQDGNQRSRATPEWTVNLYDPLDRLTLTALYRTTKTNSELQSAIASAVVNTVTVVNAAQPITDLVISKRDPSVNRYAAQNSISFIADGAGGFISGDNDEFTAEIDGSAQAEPVTVTNTGLTSPISSADLNNATTTTILKYLFYDEYAFSKASAFNTSFENPVAYATDGSSILSLSPTARTRSMPTGSLVRVLGTGVFLASTQYYDDKGRPLQSIEENIKGGKDITTLQHHFDGRLLSTHTRHGNAGSDFNNYTVLTKHLFDKIGRVTAVQKKYGTNDFVNIARYDVDEFGRLKNKQLAPGYTGTGGTELESLRYSYNIHSQITGINKEYALKTPGQYDKWGHYFGLYLGYDNRDAIFTKTELNGQVSGLLWNTMGDDAQRRYDYTYDNAGRLTNALFTEKQNSSDSWNTDRMNLTVTGYNGQIEYDLNGNLQSMLHKTVLAGSHAAVVLDDLRYTYASFSNKLTKVTDQSSLGNLNGTFGDFKDGNNMVADDYVYDENGNLIIDLNKNITPPPVSTGIAGAIGGVIYNFLDKPEQISIAGKGIIKIVYDADGNKLQRLFLPEATDKPHATVTTYIDQYLYQETVEKQELANKNTWQRPGGEVQYLHFEEGRVRVIQPIAQNNGFDALQVVGTMKLPNGKQGSFDYYIRDYQQNVRMILTDETHFSSGTATMEQNRANNEEPVFGQTGGANELVQTRFPVNQIPGQTVGAGWQNNTIGEYVSKLGNLAAAKVGPNSLLKVMAGDELSATTQYYYQPPAGNGGSSNIVSNVLNSLLAALSGGGSSLIHAKNADIITQLGQNPAFGNIVAPQEAGIANQPKAYLSVLFFDERFNFIAEGSNQLQVSEADNSNANLTLLKQKAPKNGYAYIYVSNSSDVNVYFDNLKVAHTRGRIVEENHYYAFGLKIAAISSKKLADQTGKEGHTKNEYGYNDKELQDDGDLNWYDYGFRNYDAQIGRFVQLDPLTDDYPFLTPYQYGSNDPITNIDLDGLEGISATGLVDVVVKNTPRVAQATASTVGSVAGSFLKGLGQSALSTLGSIGNAIIHPIETGKAIGQALANPVQTGKALYNAAKNTYNDFLNGDADARANILGNLTGDIAQAFIGTGAAKAATYALNASKVERALLKFSSEARAVAAANKKVKYIGRLEDLKNIPRNQTLLDDLPNKWSHLPQQEAAKYLWRQNSSVLRKALRDGYEIKDASWFRPNSELAPIKLNPSRTIRQTFLGAERNLLNNRGL